MSATQQLSQEMKTYERERDRLIKENVGQYVLIRDGEIIGMFDTYGDAIKSGYERFGLKPFLVKQIQGVEMVQHFTRDIIPCRF